MTILINTLIVIASLIGMEIFAWAFHKYYMHGRGWGWHESHHIRTEGAFEKNDLYGVCFSVIACGMFLAGSLWWQPLWFMALGVTLYGIFYGIVHDGLVHQRWPFNIPPRSKYLKRLVHAHKIHHHTTVRDGAVSFGFLWARDPEDLKRRLKSN